MVPKESIDVYIRETLQYAENNVIDTDMYRIESREVIGEYLNISKRLNF